MGIVLVFIGCVQCNVIKSDVDQQLTADDVIDKGMLKGLLDQLRNDVGELQQRVVEREKMGEVAEGILDALDDDEEDADSPDVEAEKADEKIDMEEKEEITGEKADEKVDEIK